MFRDVTNKAAVFSSAELFSLLHLSVRSGQHLTERMEERQSGVSPEQGSTPDFAFYIADRKTDPSVLKLDITLRHQGKVYKSHVRAEKLWPGAFEVRALTVDNAIHKLDEEYDIREALRTIGHNHVRAIHCRTLPEPSKQKKDFTEMVNDLFGRFIAKIHTPKPQYTNALSYVRKTSISADGN